MHLANAFNMMSGGSIGFVNNTNKNCQVIVTGNFGIPVWKNYVNKKKLHVQF